MFAKLFLIEVLLFFSSESLLLSGTILSSSVNPKPVTPDNF